MHHCLAPSMYFIHCGDSLTTVSVMCDHIRHRASQGTHSGSVKQITLRIETLGRTVFVGVVAADDAGNTGEVSNIIEVYAADPNPTTAVTVTTGILVLCHC